ncbi:unnamed protein product [Caretta caretta]
MGSRACPWGRSPGVELRLSWVPPGQEGGWVLQLISSTVGLRASRWVCLGQGRTARTCSGARTRIAAAGKQQHITHMMAFNLPDLFSTAQFYQLPTSDMQFQ